jgi:site-specific DNA-methyltransferase (cytosine-N4-specific)
MVTPTFRILEGEARAVLETLEPESVHCIATSPPYWAVRDYGHPDQLGLERTPGEYVARLVSIFEACKRVLRPDGTLWVNIGDTYSSKSKGSGGATVKQKTNAGSYFAGRRFDSGLPDKSLVGVPWRFAFAMQDAGWILRSEVIWHKPNAMPHSVTDRLGRDFEHIFLFSRSARYYFDHVAIQEPGGKENTKRNKRAVWSVATVRGYQPPGQKDHYATYSGALIRPCILASTSRQGVCPVCGAQWRRVIQSTGVNWRSQEKIDTDKSRAAVTQTYKLNGKNYQRARVGTNTFVPTCPHGDIAIPATVLDPFNGTATTGAEALRLGRSYLGIELVPEYAALSKQRLAEVLAGGNPASTRRTAEPAEPRQMSLFPVA